MSKNGLIPILNPSAGAVETIQENDNFISGDLNLKTSTNSRLALDKALNRDTPSVVPTIEAVQAKEAAINAPEKTTPFSQTLKATVLDTPLANYTARIVNGEILTEAENPSYDAYSEVKGTEYEQHWEYFLNANGPSDVAKIKKQIDREDSVRDTLASSSVAAQLTAGVLTLPLDPINFIPVAGSAYRATKTGRFLAGAANTAASGALGAGLSEAALQATQITRTPEESVANIAAGTVLAGILGGAGSLLSKQKFDDLADKVQKDIQDESPGYYFDADGNIVQQGGESLSAAVTPVPRALQTTSAEEGVYKGPLNIAGGYNASTKFSPNQRVLSSDSVVAKRAIQGLVRQNLYSPKNLEGIANAASVENNLKLYDAGLATALKESRNNFKKFRDSLIEQGGNPLSLLDPKAADTRLKDYNSKVYDALISGDVHEVPEVEASAKSFRKNVFEPLKKEAVEAGILDEDVSIENATSYLMIQYDKGRIVAQEPEFRKFIAQEVKNTLVPSLQKEHETKMATLANRSQEAYQRVKILEEELARVKATNTKAAKGKLSAKGKSETLFKQAAGDTVLNDEELLRVLDSYKAAAKVIREKDTPTLSSLFKNPLDKDFVKNTQIKNDQGDLIKVYHGTEAQFDDFDLEAKPTSGAWHGKGIYFATDPGHASQFAGDTGRVIPAYLDVRKLFIEDEMQDFNFIKDIPQGILQEVLANKKRLSEIRQTQLEQYQAGLRLLPPTVAPSQIDPTVITAWDLRAIGSEKYSKALQNMGYDGIRAGSRFDEIEYIVFDPSQIKFAKDYDPAIKKQKAMSGSPPKSLSDFIRARGGVFDKSGRLEKIFNSRNRLSKGISAKEKLSDVNGEKVNTDMKTFIDTAWREGYFPEYDAPPKTMEFLSILEDELDGVETRFSMKDLDQADKIQQAKEFLNQVGDFGIDIGKIRDAKTLRETQIGGKSFRDILISREISALKNKIKTLDDKATLRRQRFESNVGDSPDEFANTIAADITRKIIGFDTVKGSLPYDLKIGVRGPAKERTLNFIQQSKLKPWLVTDIEKLARDYTRVMGTDIQMQKQFGDLNLEKVLANVSEEYELLRAKATTEKERTRLKDQEDSVKSDLVSLKDVVRGNYGQSANPDAFLPTAARNFRNFNYLTKMGAVVLASVVDTGNIILKHGLTRFLGDGIKPLITNIKGFKLAAKDTKFIGNASEVILRSRVNALGDLSNPYSTKSSFENFVGALTQNFGKLNMLSQWTDFSKNLASTVIQKRVASEIGNLVDNKITNKNKAYLALLGIDERNANKIYIQIKKHRTTEEGLPILNLNKWDDKDAFEAMANALNLDIDRTIVTPGAGEIPLAFRSEVGKTLFQFKSFLLAANQQITIASMQQADAAVVSGVVSLVTMGMFVYAMQKIARGEELPDNPEEWVVEGIDRSGLITVISEVNGYADILGVGARNAIGTREASSTKGQAVISRMGGPTVSSFMDATDVTVATAKKTFGDHTFTEAEQRKAIKMLPYNNLFYVRGVLENVNKSLDK